jgi:hypothetical protein
MTAFIVNPSDLKARKPYKAHNALGVITKDASIRAFLKENDPAALKQAEAAYESSVDPNELLRDAIHAYHEDAHMMHKGTAEDRRWGLELLMANVIKAIEQSGFTVEDIVAGGRDVLEQREAENDGGEPNWLVTPEEEAA